MGEHVVEQLDWRVRVIVRVSRRRRYKRTCRCDGPLTVTAPGPAKAIGKGLFTHAFLAMLIVERFVAGRSQNSLVTGLSRHGAEISPATLAGACAQIAGLLAPLADRIVERSRGSAHLHADETRWRVFAPDGGGGSARWWLWVFIGADTVCFVMDPTRSADVLAAHVGIDAQTGQLTDDDRSAGEGPRRLVLCSDFYAVYVAAGRRADGIVNLYCWAHVRRYFLRAGDANPAQLGIWARQWRERIGALYRARRPRRRPPDGGHQPEPGGRAAPRRRVHHLGQRDRRDRHRPRRADGDARAAGAGEEGPRDDGPGVGGARRAPRLPPPVAG